MATPAPGLARTAPHPAAGAQRTLQRAAEAKTPLADKAKAIWNTIPSDNERAKAATTIAVARVKGGILYAFTNDVGKPGAAAQKKATELGASGTFEQAGAGFHAEMWAVIRAKQEEVDIESIGASRACCKQCSAVLEYEGIHAEVTGAEEYQSWVNPLTCDVKGEAVYDFESEQRKDIPDFRLRNINYWWYRDDNKIKYDKTPRDG